MSMTNHIVPLILGIAPAAEGCLWVLYVVPLKSLSNPTGSGRPRRAGL
jgi:hypothetical protein